MRNRALRPLATILSLLLATSMTVQAGPISFSDVVQVMGSSRNATQVPDLRFRNATQNNGQTGNDGRRSNAGPTPTAATPTPVDLRDTSRGAASDASDSLLAGVALKSDEPSANIDVISEGDLEGSICDCGEIPLEEHHMRLWPLLFLSAIPFFFIHHKDCNTCPLPTPTPPTPPIPPTPPTPPCKDCNPIPEPTSLLLLGSGLVAISAGLRRRYARIRLQKGIAATKEA